MTNRKTNPSKNREKITWKGFWKDYVGKPYYTPIGLMAWTCFIYSLFSESYVKLTAFILFNILIAIIIFRKFITYDQ